jgi:hypothetical protein
MAKTSKPAKKPENYWENRVKTLLKVELTRQNVTYAGLSDRLQKMGLETETEPNVRNKLSRGTFSAMFLVQCLEALGVQELRL